MFCNGDNFITFPNKIKIKKGDDKITYLSWISNSNVIYQIEVEYKCDLNHIDDLNLNRIQNYEFKKLNEDEQNLLFELPYSAYITADGQIWKRNDDANNKRITWWQYINLENNEKIKYLCMEPGYGIYKENIDYRWESAPIFIKSDWKLFKSFNHHTTTLTIFKDEIF